MKKILLITMLLLISFLFLSGCDDDDWAEYTHETYTKSAQIEGNIFKIADIEDELSTIVLEYADNMLLTKAEYIMFRKNKGTATFEFFKVAGNGENKATLISIEVDLSTLKTTKIEYFQGHGKRVSGVEREIGEVKNKDILTYFNDKFNSNIWSQYTSTPYIDISITGDSIISNILEK